MIFGFFRKKSASAVKEAKPQQAANEQKIGDVTHYFPHVKACVVKLTAPLNAGERIHIIGHTTDITQDVSSMQIDGKPITSAQKGQEIGILVKDKVRATDTVYKIVK